MLNWPQLTRSKTCLFTAFKRVVSLACAAVTLVCATAQAHEMIAPERYKDLPGIRQRHFFVPGSSVAYANYDLLRLKFPAIAEWNEAQIDAWIVENFAYISENQLRLRGIRTDEFQVDLEKSRRFLHPPAYHRAAMASAKVDGKTVGLVDLKGSGFSNDEIGLRSLIEIQEARFAEIQQMDDETERTKALHKLRTKDHSDGVMTFGEGIAELTRQAAVQASYDLYNAAHGTSHQTNEVLFLVQIPITALKENHQEALVITGRESNWRGSSGLISPPSMYSDSFGGRQSTLFDSAIDFGGVVVTNPELRATFGESGPNTDPQQSPAWSRGHEVARDYLETMKYDPAAAHDIVRRHVAEMLQPLRERLAAIAPMTVDEKRERYIVQRLNVRGEAAHARIAQEFAQLPIETIETELGRLFQQIKAPDTLVAPAVKALLSRPEYKKGSARRRELLSRTQTYLESRGKWANASLLLPKILNKKFDGVFACSAVF